jgi:hypothetical protein
MDPVRKSDGSLEILPKASLTGLDGWIPIAEKNLPYELTASFLLMADRPGVPRPIKLPDQLRPFVPLDKPLDEQVGRELGKWAAGGAPSAHAATSDHADEIEETTRLLLAYAQEHENRSAVQGAITRNRNAHSDDEHVGWLRRQLERTGQGAAA